MIKYVVFIAQSLFSVNYLGPGVNGNIKLTHLGARTATWRRMS